MARHHIGADQVRWALVTLLNAQFCG